MTRRINYEDDIFTIALQVRCLQDTLKLEVDADLFRDRVLGDIQWIDSVTARLYQSLKDSSYYVKRQEHLKELAKLKRAFIDALDSLVNRRAPLSSSLGDVMPSIDARRQANNRDIEEIKTLVEGGGASEEEHIVSAEELKFLMTTDDDEADR